MNTQTQTPNKSLDAKTLADVLEAKALIKFLNDPDRILMTEAQQKEHLEFISKLSVQTANKIASEDQNQ